MKKHVSDIDIKVNMSIEEDEKVRTAYASAKIILNGVEIPLKREVMYISADHALSHAYNRTGARIDAARLIWLKLFCAVRGQIEEQYDDPQDSVEYKCMEYV